MYATCLFCHSDLGRNAAIEAFPVGRRLAYDQARGRLWVVCRRCERWNLTPQEERWEAMEQAERLYRGTRLRASTDNVGLARLRDGMELVRIGRPLRPEFAAWRYGDQFGRRRRRHLLRTGSVAGAAAVAIVGGPVLGLFSLGAVSPLWHLFNAGAAAARRRRTLSVTVPGAPSPLLMNHDQIATVRLLSDRRGGFTLEVTGRHPEPRRSVQTGFTGLRPATYRVIGDDAIRVGAAVLPSVNARGGARRVVAEAVDLLDVTGGSVDAFARIAEAGRKHGNWTAWRESDVGRIRDLPPAASLALEMAAHEEQERRALDGELRELEASWQEAEEIAAIADGLLLPESVGARFGQLKGASGRSNARAGAPSSPTTDSGAASNS